MDLPLLGKFVSGRAWILALKIDGASVIPKTSRRSSLKLVLLNHPRRLDPGGGQ
jgi:hypothetical protein